MYYVVSFVKSLEFMIQLAEFQNRKLALENEIPQKITMRILEN